MLTLAHILGPTIQFQRRGEYVSLFISSDVTYYNVMMKIHTCIEHTKTKQPLHIQKNLSYIYNPQWEHILDVKKYLKKAFAYNAKPRKII